MDAMSRVLIVDDRAERLLALEAMLRSEGWTTEVEQQWIPALELARLDPPTLILATLPLLVAERHASLRRAKAIWNLAAVPFVLLRTPDVDARDEELALDLGADAVLPYPDEARSLSEPLRALLRERRPSVRPTSAADAHAAQLDRDVLIARLKQRIRALEREHATGAEDIEHLRMALGAARMGTFVRDLKRQRVRWTSGYKVTWDGDPRAREESIAELEATVHPEDLVAMQRAMQHAIDTNTEYEHEYRVVFNDKVRWIQGRGRPVHDEHGQPDRMMGIFFEVTERRRLEQQVRQTQKMEAIGLLAGGIAHDFNNILGAIMGNEELLRLCLRPGDEAWMHLDEISKASRRAKNLVQQILAFSRNQPIEKSALAPAAALLETASLLRATLPADVELITECATDAPNVLADPTQLQQVLLNLGTNAWHALNGKPGRIGFRLQNAVLETERATPRGRLLAGRHAHITVTDNGAGMTSDVLARIFEPFFTTKPKGHGTGLGLAVVHEIVTEHRGVVWATSEPGVGTTFHIYVPATQLSEAPTAHPDAAQPAAVSKDAPRKRVIYIDDEPALIRVMTRMLAPLGYEVEGFTDVAAAFTRFRAAAAEFELAITDLTMPTASGMDVAQGLLSIRPRMPIVLLSGYITSERREHARRLGIREVLNKPLTTRDLCGAIERALHKG